MNELVTILFLVASAFALAFGLRERTTQRRLASALAARDTAQARFETLLGQLPLAIAVVREGGEMMYMNRRFHETCAYGVAELRHIDDWWERAYPDPEYRALAQNAALEMLQRARATGGVAGPREVRIRCGDGSLKDIEFHYIDLGDRGVWTLRDVSEQYLNDEVARLANEHLLTQLRENQRLQEALREQATRDALTGLFNRRYLDETLDRELARAMREGYPVAVMMIDIDFFKRLNDTYGHLAGDEVLRALAGILTQSARTEDVICRFGGEEFAAVLPKMPLNVALERAEGWRAAFAALPMTFGEFELRATLSVGVAAFPGDGRSRDALIDAADNALYRAKAGGRNRVEVVTDIRAAAPSPAP